jgi:thiosulfate dehydrogenase
MIFRVQFYILNMKLNMMKIRKPITFIWTCIVAILLTSLFSQIAWTKEIESTTQATSVINRIPYDFETPAFPNTTEGKLGQYGQLLINKTYTQIGPTSKNPITNNRLACANCHLNGGTKPFALPLIGLSGVFPMYIGREDKIESLEERVNGCIERSMNGKAIEVNSNEMRAIITYIKHISKNTVIGQRTEGQGLTQIKNPERPASPQNGAKVYSKHCISCHGENGEGKATSINGEDEYLFPPLWGPNSFNDGAGMARILTAARFIKGNMPLGTTALNPVLTDEEAYDVAAYINSNDRPIKSKKNKDYPNLTKKPKDSPYPPFSDSISQQQHKYGPFNF